MKIVLKRVLAVCLVMLFACAFPVTGSCAVEPEAVDAIDAVNGLTLVESIEWTWNVNTLYAGTGQAYSFSYSSNVYSIYPKNADIKSATLICNPSNAMQIDNINKTFIVNPLEKGVSALTVTLTLYASGADADCLPAVKTVTIRDQDPGNTDLPITGIEWNFTNGGRKPVINYYQYGEYGAPTVLYYMPTSQGNPGATCQFDVYPQSVSMQQILATCRVSVSSSDRRVIVFDEPTGRLIPVGNGSADVTITLTTPKGKTFSDTVTATVQYSPYTPIVSAEISYDKKNTSAVVTFDPMLGNTMTLRNTHTINLTALLNKNAENKNADLDHDEIVVELDNGLKLKTVKKCEYSWSSSNDSVAVVMKGGKLNVLSKKGETTITLTINDNGVEFVKTLRVQVTNCIPYDSVIELNAREEYQLDPIIQAGDVNYVLDYKSSKPTIAFVNYQGVVTGRRLGTALITITASDDRGNIVGIDAYSVKVKYTFGQWMIMIFLFGWIWY